MADSNLDFKSLLNKAVDEVEAPKPVPTGTYLAVVKGHEFGETSRKKTPYCRFFFTPMEPQEDVDEDALEEFGGQSKLTGTQVREDFYLTDAAMFRLRKFIEEQLNLDCSGRSFDEMIPEAANNQVMISIKHDVSDNGEVVYANIASFAPVE